MDDRQINKYIKKSFKKAKKEKEKNYLPEIIIVPETTIYEEDENFTNLK
jgi:hypothetical protein